MAGYDETGVHNKINIMYFQCK